MNKDKDYYKILGISVDAEKNEIRSAYRSLARKYHPDANQGNKVSESKFKEIGEAYSILIDDVKKEQYDLIKGYVKKKPNTSQQAKKQASDAYSSTRNKASAPSDVDKKGFGNVFADIFDKIFEKESQDKPAEKEKTVKAEAYKGEDISTDISISIVEALNGTIRKINILHSETCPKCKGKRYINGAQCINCSGKGEISTHKKLNVKIPPNVKEGSKIKLKGEGNRGINGGENGDLYLLVHIIKNSIFEFEGLNVNCELPITVSEAALGAEILVPTIDGEISMKIPPETHNGQKFRLAGQGVPDPNTTKRGDQVVSVYIVIPPNITEKEKELYQELAKIRKYNPREKIVTESK